MILFNCNNFIIFYCYLYTCIYLKKKNILGDGSYPLWIINLALEAWMLKEKESSVDNIIIVSFHSYLTF